MDAVYYHLDKGIHKKIFVRSTFTNVLKNFMEVCITIIDKL